MVDARAYVGMHSVRGIAAGSGVIRGLSLLNNLINCTCDGLSKVVGFDVPSDADGCFGRFDDYLEGSMDGVNASPMYVEGMN